MGAASNRRGFLYRLAGLVLGAPLVAKLGPKLPALLAPIESITPAALDAMFAAEAQRLGVQLVKAMSRPSPYLSLLEAGTFPENLGNPLRVIVNPQTHANRT